MIIIPGFVIALFTFPGVIIHEAAHMLFCRLFGLAVLDVNFFRCAMKGPSGYVIHEPTASFRANFFISMGPFIINSALCILLCLPCYFSMRVFAVQEDNLIAILLWLGISIGMHAFPSGQDGQNLWNAARRKMMEGHRLAALIFPVFVVIQIRNALRVIWFDLIFAGCIGFVLPDLIFKGLAQVGIF